MKTYKIRNKADGGILEVTEAQLAEFGLEVPKAEKGKMIKRKDGSYSRRGLWDNIRANKGSGKKPTKAMLEQEAKIRAAEKAYGGYMEMGGYMNPYMAYGGYLPMAQEGMEQMVPVVEPSMLTPIDPTQLPLRTGVEEQLPFNIRGEFLAKEAKQETAKPTNKYVGLIDTIVSMGLPSDKESRKEYAKRYNIKNYDFSSEKNKELLAKIKSDPSKLSNKGYNWSTSNQPSNYGLMGTTESGKNTPFLPQSNAAILNNPVQFAPSPYVSQVDNTRVSKLMPSIPPVLMPNIDPRSLVAPNIDPRALNPALAKYTPKYPNVTEKKPWWAGSWWDIFKETGGYVNPYMADGGGIDNPGFRALPEYVQEKIKANMAMGGCMSCGGRMESGGKMPQWLAEVRFKAAGKENELGDYGYLDEAGDGKWIQKATRSIKRRGTKGVCTGSKFGGPGCPPGSKRYNLAKTFRKMAKSRKKADGGYALGNEYEMTDAEIAKLTAMGYKIKEV